MNATMTITPDCNIDYNAMKVIDEKKISKQTFGWTQEINVYDLRQGKEEVINVKDVSLYENLLILDGERYKILAMLSK